MVTEIPTLLDWIKAWIVFILGSGLLLVILNAARRLWQRGRGYVTIQDVPDGDGETL